MLKIRLIGLVLVKENIVVQSIGFRRYLPIGVPEITINYLDRWGVDEIVVLHLDAREKRQPPTAEQVRSYALQCQVPLTVGGGISQVSDIKEIIRSGADKVVINTSLLTQPEIITQAGDLFGQQSIVVSVDARRQNDNYMAFTHSGRQTTNTSVQNLAQEAVKRGAGELLINSIDCDGAKQGYDLELIRSLAENINIPIIACGGAGHPKDIHAAIQSGASAVAVGNLFHFTEHSVTVVKQYLTSLSLPIRLDSYFDYKNFSFDEKGRPAKQSDEALDALRFQYVPEEVI